MIYLRLAVCLAFLLSLQGCVEKTPERSESEADSASEVTLETAADSAAMLAVDAFGGLDTWSQLPYLRFQFGFESDGERRTRNRHLWDRNNNRYRLEYSISDDSSAVVLFDTQTIDGTAFINGEEVDDDTREAMIESAHRSYVNDTYWLLAPTKLFDDGVVRELEEQLDDGDYVLTLSFGDVGYTPDDQYWITIDNTTGLVQEWTYQLQGRDGTSTYAWTDYEEFATPAGNVVLANRKVRPDGSFSILTDNISFPVSVEEEYFESGESMLN